MARPRKTEPGAKWADHRRYTHAPWRTKRPKPIRYAADSLTVISLRQLLAALARCEAQPGHTCHWPNCDVEIPASLFCCRPHWFALPRVIRREVWRTYRKGQEVDKNPSPEYLAAARVAIDWAHDHPLDTTTWAAAAR